MEDNNIYSIKIYSVIISVMNRSYQIYKKSTIKNKILFLTDVIKLFNNQLFKEYTNNEEKLIEKINYCLSYEENIELIENDEKLFYQVPDYNRIRTLILFIMESLKFISYNNNDYKPETEYSLIYYNKNKDRIYNFIKILINDYYKKNIKSIDFDEIEFINYIINILNKLNIYESYDFYILESYKEQIKINNNYYYYFKN